MTRKRVSPVGAFFALYLAVLWFGTRVGLGDEPATKDGSVAEKKAVFRTAEEKLKHLRLERDNLQRRYDILVDKSNLENIANQLTTINKHDELIKNYETNVAAKEVDLLKTEMKEVLDKMGTFSAELATTRDRQKATYLEYLEKSVLLRSILRQVEERTPLDQKELSGKDRIEEEQFRRDEDIQITKLIEDLKRFRETIDRYDEQIAKMQNEVVDAKIEHYDRLRQVIILENKKKSWNEVKSILENRIKENRVFDLY